MIRSIAYGLISLLLLCSAAMAQAPTGKVELMWLGQSCFRIITPTGKVILIDPWLLQNPNVSSVITGASRPEQVTENMRAIDVVAALTPEVMAAIDGATRAASDLEGPRLEL